MCSSQYFWSLKTQIKILLHSRWWKSSSGVLFIPTVNHNSETILVLVPFPFTNVKIASVVHHWNQKQDQKRKIISAKQSHTNITHPNPVTTTYSTCLQVTQCISRVAQLLVVQHLKIFPPTVASADDHGFPLANLYQLSPPLSLMIKD